MRTCTICKEEKGDSSFSFIVSGGYGCLRKICDECRRLAAKTRDNKKPRQAKSLALKNCHSITVKTYERLSRDQNNACWICFKEDITLVVDHNHTTGKIRGLLCDNCNLGIGNLKSSPAIMLRAIKYINDPPAKLTLGDYIEGLSNTYKYR